MLPLIIHLNANPKVNARKDTPSKIGKAMFNALIQATVSILSYPLDIGMLPLIIHLNANPKVNARKDTPSKIGKAMFNALISHFFVMR